MLTIESLPEYRFPTYRLTGSLDALGVQVFENEILTKTQQALFVVLDMKALTFLSSAGIRKILSLEKDLRSKGGYLFLCDITDQVSQVLEISGLLSQFHIVPNLNEAVGKALRAEKDEHHHKQYHFQDRIYELSKLENNDGVISGWKINDDKEERLLHASVNELGYGLGQGCFAENREAASDRISPFLSLPGFFAFKPEGAGQVTDYIHTGPAGVHGVYISQYLGTCSAPDCKIEIPLNEGIESDVLIDDLFTMADEVMREPVAVLGVTGFLKFRNDEGAGEFRLCSGWMIVKKELAVASKLATLRNYLPMMDEDQEMFYIRRSLLLKGMKVLPAQNHLQDCLKQVLEDESLEYELTTPPSGSVLEGRLWLYLPLSFHNLNDDRMIIETEDSQVVPDPWDLIIRSVYHYASRVVLQPLHGGFSAKTFMVASYDRDGRKRLPTVLKLANSNIIGREERGYRENVQPFILNNSVSVLGATYYGDTGGICYNFLGVGGPESKLRWLTHIYQENEPGVLIPLFDRIFKGILKPWYGQPKWDKRYLFRDHNPLFPFFANILEDAQRILNINADEKYIDCKWLERQVLNPYWYLKHEWPKRENEASLCYSSVCHGDLNMQNILIDEKENIYIIDFSETEIKNIVSDFARLEPIFKMEMTRMKDETDLGHKLRFEEAVVKMDKLGQRPEFIYDGDDPAVSKAYEMICKIREYAKQVTIFEEDPLPYWLAVLEWTLPYVSYGGQNPLVQLQSAYSAGLICERLYNNK